MNLNNGNNKAITAGTSTRNKVKETAPKNFIYFLYTSCAVFVIFWIIYMMYSATKQGSPDPDKDSETVNTENKVISKESSSNDTLDSVLSLDWTTFPPGDMLIKHFDSPWWIGAISVVTVTIFAFLIGKFFKRAYDKSKIKDEKEREKFAIFELGISGWYIIIISITILVFYVVPEDTKNKSGSFISSDRPVYIDLRTKVNKVDTSDVRYISIHQAVELHLPDFRRTDGVVAAGCVEVIGPESLVSKLPNQHLVYVSGENLYVKTLVMSDKAKEVAFNEQRNTVQIRALVVEATVGQAEDICPHSY